MARLQMKCQVPVLARPATSKFEILTGALAPGTNGHGVCGKGAAIEFGFDATPKWTVAQHIWTFGPEMVSLGNDAHRTPTGALKGTE